MKKINYKITSLIIALAFMVTAEWAIAQESKSTGGSGYKTAVGIRGGWNSGITLKHFISNDAALEVIVGSRWRGVNVTGLYEIQKGNALDVSRLSWEYGLGARIGTYNGRYYRDGYKNFTYENRDYTIVSLVGIFGMEYYFEEIPFTLGLDLMPYIDFIGNGNGFIDGSLAFRYVF